MKRVRSVVTDATGQYRIVDLRPGIYTVTFALPGFSAVKREGIELSGNFVATVNADLRVGALEETVTVTGETPIVDVQSARTQQIISRDVSRAIPSSRNALGLQALIPGMSATGGSASSAIRTPIPAASAGRCRAGPPPSTAAAPNDSRIYADGINMGWAGGSGGGGNMPQVAAAQEVVMTISGGLAECRDGRRDLQRRPARGAEQLQRPVQLQRLERRAARQQLHAGAQGRGPAGAVPS